MKVLMRTRSDGKLFNIARLRAKTKAYVMLIRELLFADDAALTSLSEEGLQHLVDKLSHAFKEFGLAISLKKTNILAQGAESHPSHHRRQHGVEGCGHLHLLGLHRFKLDFARFWDQLQDRQSSCCHGQTQQASVGQWPVERKDQDMCLPSFCPVDSPLWQRVVNDLCQTRAATQRIAPPLPSAPVAHQVAGQSHQHRGPGARWLTEHAITAHSATPSCTQWLGHTHRMGPDRLPREILYGELREGVRRPLLRYKDVIKRDLRSALIDTSAWEDIAKHRDAWRQSVKAGVSKAEANTRVQGTCKRAARKERAASARDSTRHVCATCNRDCHSRIGLHSHKILHKSPALTIASSRRGCHYYY